MNDKERILTNIVRRLYSTLLDLPPNFDFSKGYMGDDYEEVHFKSTGNYMIEDSVKEGDLVLCITNPTHDWAIGFVHTVYDLNHLILREIGSNRIGEIYNESFAIIKGMRETEIMDGNRWEIRRKILKAFRWSGEDFHRFNRIEFNDFIYGKGGDRDALIWVRAKWGLGEPYSIPIHWNKKTTIKSILAIMRGHGFGEREFEPTEEMLARRKI